MAKMTYEEKVKFRTKVFKLWESGKFKTRGDLAAHLGLPYQHVQQTLTGRNFKQGTVEQPDGNCLKKMIYGKKFWIYDDGRVWSVESNRFIGFTHKSGYKQIGVLNPATGKLENFRISRLMLEVFVRKPKEGEFARHLDDDPGNNTLPNLAWGDPQDNSDDCVRNGKSPFGERNSKAKLTEKIVKRLIKEYRGQPYRTFARDFIERHNLDINGLAVVRILRAQSWTAVTGWTKPAAQK